MAGAAGGEPDLDRSGRVLRGREPRLALDAPADRAPHPELVRGRDLAARVGGSGQRRPRRRRGGRGDPVRDARARPGPRRERRPRTDRELRRDDGDRVRAAGRGLRRGDRRRRDAARAARGRLHRRGRVRAARARRGCALRLRPAAALVGRAVRSVAGLVGRRARFEDLPARLLRAAGRHPERDRRPARDRAPGRARQVGLRLSRAHLRAGRARRCARILRSSCSPTPRRCCSG